MKGHGFCTYVLYAIWIIYGLSDKLYIYVWQYKLIWKQNA